MREPWVGEAGGPLCVAPVGAQVLDDLEHPVAVVTEPHDRGLHGRVVQQFAHVGADRVAVHHIGRREHGESQHVAVVRHRRLAVGNAHTGVCQAGDHVSIVAHDIVPHVALHPSCGGDG